MNEEITERTYGTVPLQGIPVTNPVFKRKEDLSTLEWRALQVKLTKWMKAEQEGRLMILPRKPGSVVYTIVDKCRPDYRECPYSGGYGTARCTKDNSRCGPYIELRKYSVREFPEGTYYTTREEAEAALAEMK